MKLKRAISVLMVSCITLSISYVPLNNINIDYASAEAQTENVTVTEYRYRDTTYQESEVLLPEPYVYVSERQEYTEYGNWSDWSRDVVSSSDTREVNTDVRQIPTGYVMVNYRTRGNPDTIDSDCYRVTGLSVNVRAEPNTSSQSFGKTVDRSTVFQADGYSGNWVHAKSIHTSNGVVSGWLSMNYCTPSGNTYVQYRNYSVNGDYGSYDLNAGWGEYGGNEWVIDPGTFSSLRTIAPWEFATGLRVHDDSYNVEGYNMTDQTGYILNDGYASMIWFLNRVNYSEETWYHYRDRQKKTIYTYSVTDDWSEWSETPIEKCENREIETRTVVKQEEIQKGDVSYGSNDNYTFGVDDYSFLNSHKYFNNDYYHISDEYKKIYEKLDNKSYESIKNRTQIKPGENGKWSGSCYGLACMEILVKSGKISPGSIHDGAESLYQIPIPKDNEEVESLINFYHLQQFTDYGEKKLSSIASRTSAEERVNQVIAAAEKAQESKMPALLVFDYSKNKSSQSMEAHAVVIFGIEYGEWSIGSSGVTYDSRILISDSNTFGFNDDCCMYFDSKTHEWEIPYYNKGMDYCSSRKKGKEKTAQIKYVTDDTDFMDFMRLSEKLPNNTIDTDIPACANISINSATSNIGEISYYGKSTGGINASEEVELIYHGGAIGETTDTEKSKETVNALLLNVDASYEYDSRGISDFDTILDYPESKLGADVTNGSFAVYVPDKSVSFEGENSSYNLSMVLNEGYHPTEWYKIEVSGDEADTGEITVAEDGYVFKSDSLKNGISIKASNRTSEANLGLYATADKIFIYQLSDDRIGIKLDTNNDGIFETKYTPSYLGDANYDNVVSIADAVRLQKYLLNEESIDKKEHIALDMNMDGTVDVFDFILMRKKIING